MAAELLTMSRTELDRLRVIERVIDRSLSGVRAAEQLGLTDRQVRRLVTRYRQEGPDGLLSRRRGKRGNHAYSIAHKTEVLSILREHYHDFGPTLAAEKLRDCHGHALSIETVRLWMIEAGLWEDRKIRQKRPYQPRYRRECFGELIQIDGSDHAWFEDRGPRCCLLVFIDDATSRIVEARFCPSETTLDYMHSTKRYLASYGKPVAFYSDKHSVFRMNMKSAKKADDLTQFGRALKDLNIDIYYSHSSQAKSRVERINQTL